MRFLRSARWFSLATLAILQAAGSKTASTQTQNGTQNQRPRLTLRVPVRLIDVDAIVTDDRDRPVVDLKKDDFQIFDNGRRGEIRHFSVKGGIIAVQAPDSLPKQMFPMPGPSGNLDTARRGGLDDPGNVCSPSSPAAIAMTAILREALMEKIVDAYTRAILTVQAAVYQLGYYPEDENWQGQYHQIDVKVRKPGAKVLFRQRYYAGDTLPPPEVEEPIARTASWLPLPTDPI